MSVPIPSSREDRLDIRAWSKARATEGDTLAQFIQAFPRWPDATTVGDMDVRARMFRDQAFAEYHKYWERFPEPKVPPLLPPERPSSVQLSDDPVLALAELLVGLASFVTMPFQGGGVSDATFERDTRHLDCLRAAARDLVAKLKGER